MGFSERIDITLNSAEPNKSVFNVLHTEACEGIVRLLHTGIMLEFSNSSRP